MDFEVIIPVTHYTLVDVEAVSEDEAKLKAKEYVEFWGHEDRMDNPEPETLPMDQWEVEQR